MKKDFFWISYGDLMTSLFFIMMMLFIVTVVKLEREKNASEEVVDKINEIQTALSSLDSTYFEFDERNKRYKILKDISFRGNSPNIYDSSISPSDRQYFLDAGKELFSKVDSLIKSDTSRHINYLMVVEGNTQRVEFPVMIGNERQLVWNHEYNPDAGYILSYKRALALVNLWKDNNVDFNNLDGRCEIIIAGSGYFGQSREEDETKNRKFSIQVTSKFGRYIEETKKR